MNEELKKLIDAVDMCVIENNREFCEDFAVACGKVAIAVVDEVTNWRVWDVPELVNKLREAFGFVG